MKEYDNYYTLVTELGEFYKLMAKNDFFGNNRLSNIQNDIDKMLSSNTYEIIVLDIILKNMSSDIIHR